MRKVAKYTELSSYVQGFVLFPAIDISQNIGMAGSCAVRGVRGGFGKVVQDVDFFAENLTIVAAATVYIAVVLTAMQVGLGTDLLMKNYSFQMACYGFTVFAIISPIIAVGALVVLFMFMFFANWWRAVVSHRKRLRSIGITSLSRSQSRRADDDVEVMP